MWILPVIAILFAAGQVVNIADGSADIPNLIAGGAVAALALGYFFFFRGQRRAADELLRELSVQRADLEGTGQASVLGHVLQPDAELRTFTTAISFVFVTVRLQSRFFLPGENGARSMALGCSLASLLFGWWGIPWGPVWTVQSLVSNLRGGRRVAVVDLAHGRAAAVR